MQGFVLPTAHAKNIEEFHEWPDFASLQLLGAAYRVWASELRLGKHEILNIQQLRDFFTQELQLQKARPRGLAIIGEDRDGNVMRQNRPRAYRLPSLDDARVMFDKHHGEVTDWEIDPVDRLDHEPQSDASEHPLPEGDMGDDEEPTNE